MSLGIILIKYMDATTDILVTFRPYARIIGLTIKSYKKKFWNYIMHFVYFNKFYLKHIFLKHPLLNIFDLHAIILLLNI